VSAIRPIRADSGGFDMQAPLRRVVVFVVLFVLYQAAEGFGADVLHSFAVQAALVVACVLVAWPLGRWLGYRGYDAYALSGPGWLPLLAGGLLLSGLANLAALAMGLGLGIFAWTPGGAVDLAPLAPAAFAVAAFTTFVPSLAEDILTRGFWWRASGIRWKGAVFVAVSAILYTLNHVYRLANGPTECLMLLCFGVAYASAMLRSGSLWPAVGLHWGWNLSNALFGGMLPVEVRDHLRAQVLWGWVNLAVAVIVLTLPYAPRPRRDPG
jgi:membrane protease YdiL (CAAX protease family)